MPPRKRQKGLAKDATTIKWDEQPVVEGGTFETPYGRLQTREYPPTGGRVVKAQIGRLHDSGSWEKLKAKCKVAISNADNRDVVLETYLKHYDDETIEAAAAAREEQGRKAVEAAVAASDEMGLRGGRVAQPKSDVPLVKSKHGGAVSLGLRLNAAFRAYYASRAKVVYDRSNGGTVIIERLGGGSAGRLSCVSELGAYQVKQHPLLVRRFTKLTPITDKVDAADDVVEVVDEDAMAVDATAEAPAPMDEASDDEAAAREDEADAPAPIEGAWRPAFRFGRDEADAPSWYYYCAEGITHGPFSADQMIRWAEKGELAPDLLVARDDGGSQLVGSFVELQSLCSDPASPTAAEAEVAAPVPMDDATPAPAATAPETLAAPDEDVSGAGRAEAVAVEAQVDELLDLVDTGMIGRTVNSLNHTFSCGDRGRFDRDVLDAALKRFGESTEGQLWGVGGKYERLAAKLTNRPRIMDAPPGLRTTRPLVLNRDMEGVDPSYFLNAGGDFSFAAYEERATPAAWAERLQYRYFRQKMEPFFLCGCLCLSLFSYIWTSFLTAFLITLAWGCAYMSNGHVVGLNRLVVEAELDAHVRALLDDPSRPRASAVRLRKFCTRGSRHSLVDAWTHHDAILSIPPELNRRQPRVSDDDTLLGEVRCGASGMSGHLKITCVAWCSVLACYMVVLLECNRRFPRPLHKPSARRAEEWRDAAKALGAAEGKRGRRAAHAANPVKFDPATRRGFVLTKLDLRALAEFCNYQIPKMEAFIKELDACVTDIAWTLQIPVDAVTEEMLEDALDALEEEGAVPDVGRLSAAFDLPMRRRLKAFVVELREKRKEMPDPCAQWDQNGGDLGNGTWPAARVNAADKQYTLEAVQAA
jgi:hypothetical protein